MPLDDEIAGWTGPPAGLLWSNSLFWQTSPLRAAAVTDLKC